MDFATIIGFISGSATILIIMMMGGDISLFLNFNAFFIILGGCIGSTLIRFPFKPMMSGLAIGGKISFVFKRESAVSLIERIAELSDIMRKQGPLGLEGVEISDPFLAKGVRMIADGFDANLIRENLERERDLNFLRLDTGCKVYRSIGDAAPAYGMLGTVIGMVQMFANMTDPSTLGPFMAVALLATFYGSIVGNLFCLPMADKLKLRMEEDEITDSLIIDGLVQMRENKSPSFIKDMLIAYLPQKMRADIEEAA